MAHAPKPFFRTARNAWYVQLGRAQVRLAPGPKTPATEKAAWAAFHARMAAPAGGPPAVTQAPPAPPGPTPLTVAEVFDQFLDWCRRNRKPRTYEFYKDRIQSFVDADPAAAVLPAAALRPFHVSRWADGKPTWGAMQRRGAVGAVQRAFAWAERVGHLDRSPVRHVDKPAPRRREQVLTRAGFDALLAAVPDRPFRDVLEFC